MPTQKQINSQIIISGRGGQGVLFLTRLLDESAIMLGCNVISSETHGMAMRGGSVSSSVRIGKYQSPLIPSGQADIMLAVNEHEVPFNMHLMKKDALVFVNSTACRHNAIHAEKIARGLGSPMVTNLVLLGFASANPGFTFQFDHLKKVLRKISPSKALELNLKAITEGYNLATA